MDDEYRWAGVEDPKLMVTTSHNPSSRLKQFAKVIKSSSFIIFILAHGIIFKPFPKRIFCGYDFFGRFHVNPFIPNAPFLYLLKTSENLTVF